MRITVIGAGIVGSAIAFHLARRGAQVTLLDAGEPGMGASSHSFAWINAFGKEPRHYNELNRRSLDTWDRYARLLNADVGLKWGGQLTWTSTDEEAEWLKENVSKLQSWGYIARLIDEQELTRLEPGLRPGPVSAAAISENDGHVLGTRAAQVASRRVKELGGTVRPNSPAIGLEASGKGIASVQVESVNIECDAVVLAAGVTSTEIAETANLEVPQYESPGVVVKTNPLPHLMESASVLYAPPISEDQPEIHIRQGTDGVVMIGEGTQESLARDDSQEHADKLLARASHYLPALSSAQAIPVPVGYRPMPRDEMPILGFTEKIPNLYIALTHSGITLAPLIGEFATMEILDGARIDLLDPFRLERFG
jgi:glycine/D-amino acid oxidase-like deaminating enzyme